MGEIKGRTVTIAFGIPDGMSDEEQWPYMFSQMFTHFDNDCRWKSDEMPYAKAIALKIVKAVCEENIKTLERQCGCS